MKIRKYPRAYGVCADRNINIKKPRNCTSSGAFLSRIVVLDSGGEIKARSFALTWTVAYGNMTLLIVI